MLVSDILNMALRVAGVLGVGQTTPNEMSNQALTSLNMMIGQWAAKRWLVYHEVTLTKTATGAVSYTVGPSGDFNIVARPQNLESAIVSLNPGTPQQIDAPLEILNSREDYNRIAMKSLTSMPWCIFYDNAMPLGVIYPWPAPTASLYSLTLCVKAPLTAFSQPLSDTGLPPEYDEALVYNLAERLRTIYQLPIDAAVVAVAKSGLNTIRTANAGISRLQMPAGFARSTRYNVFSDQSK